MKIEAGSRLVMIGDSITDAGRGRPVGEGDQLGNGYVSIVNSMLGAVYPERNISVLNTGISGNTARDLKARWQSDVLDLKPHWLSVMIGINDVWRQFDSVKNPERAVHAEEYALILTELISKTRPRLKGMILMSPFYIEPNRNEPLRAKVDEYNVIVHKIADSSDSVFVDTQAAFDQMCKSVYPGTLGSDRVHPSSVGTMVIARAFLKAIDFQF